VTWQVLTARALPPLPAGSRIQLSESGSSLTLQWTTPPRMSRSSFLVEASLGLGLAVWTYAGVVMLTRMLELFARDNRGDDAFILVLWLIVWTISELHLLMIVVNRIRGPRPERVILTDQHLCLVLGTSWSWRQLLRVVQRASSEIRVRRQQLASLRLENTVGQQRLLFDHGERIEIGKHLETPEREWLADVIWSWASQGSYRN